MYVLEMFTRKMEFISVENFRIDIWDYLPAYIFHTIRYVLNEAFTIRFRILISESVILFWVKADLIGWFDFPIGKFYNYN